MSGTQLKTKNEVFFLPFIPFWCFYLAACLHFNWIIIAKIPIIIYVTVIVKMLKLYWFVFTPFEHGQFSHWKIYARVMCSSQKKIETANSQNGKMESKMNEKNATYSKGDRWNLNWLIITFNKWYLLNIE